MQCASVGTPYSIISAPKNAALMQKGAFEAPKDAAQMPKGAFNSETSSVIQKRCAYIGNINSETSGDIKLRF